MANSNDGLRLIVVTLGLALYDKTWIERLVQFEVDPEFENDSNFDLCETAMEHWIAQNVDEANSLAPSGWWIIFHEWKEKQDDSDGSTSSCVPL